MAAAPFGGQVAGSSRVRQEGPVARVASKEVAGTERPVAPRLRAAVLGPRGGGTTRRRASDAFRLGFAVIVVAVSIPVMQANSAAELRLAHFLNPPPEA